MGGCAEALEQVEVALAVIRSNVAERRYKATPDVSLSAGESPRPVRDQISRSVFEFSDTRIQ